MSMQLVTLEVGGRSYPILSDILSFEAESTKKEDVAKVGIGSGIGAIVGAIAGGGKGAAIGAAVGAGAGGATVAATRGKELKYEVEHPFEFALDGDVQIALP
jgi:outer membrane lipoprotein SlyB